MDLLALVANVYFAVDELARELKDNARTITQSITSNSSKNLPQKLPPIPPSARSRSTATAVQPRDSTVSPLLNKRVRGVVDEANGLMHLRPRESTYRAQEYNAAQSIGMNCGSRSIKVRIGRKSGGEAGKAHTNGMRFLALVEL
jgi:hypothetical protein